MWKFWKPRTRANPIAYAPPAVGSPPWGPASHIAGATKHRVRGGHPDVANGGAPYLGDRRRDRPPLVRALRALAPKPRSVARACAPHLDDDPTSMAHSGPRMSMRRSRRQLVTTYLHTPVRPGARVVRPRRRWLGSGWSSRVSRLVDSWLWASPAAVLSPESSCPFPSTA